MRRGFRGQDRGRIASVAAGPRGVDGVPERAGRAAAWGGIPTALLAAWIMVAAGMGCTPERPEAMREARVESSIFVRAEIIGGRGSALGSFNKPRSVAVDGADQLYVVDMTGRVQKFSPSGEFLLSWQLPQTDLGKPKGMATDTNGNIVVVEPHYQRVNHFATNGTLVSQWGRAGTNVGELVLPRAVAIATNGDAYLSEYTTVDRVQAFRAGSRAPFLSFGRPGPGRGEFNRAEGLGFGPDGRLHVADSCNHRVQVFTADGGWTEEYGRPGGGLGELSYPYDVRVDASGRRFVCEFGNSRIQIFERDGRPLELVGRPGLRPGEFNNPWSIALDSRGNLYVADAGNHRVQKLVRREGTLPRASVAVPAAALAALATPLSGDRPTSAVPGSLKTPLP